MHTFADRLKASQQPKSPKVMVPARPHLGHNPEVNSVLHLQRMVGNLAVQRLLQNNADERNTKSTGVTLPHFGHDFSRTPIYPLAAGAIQTKLAINKPGDEYEQEADRVADQVMRMSEPKLQRACACGGECPKCKADQLSQEASRLQPKRARASETMQDSAPQIVHEVLQSPGQSLDTATRAYMEPRFGHDFSRVRVHNDIKAAESAKTINALAYTAGRDVVFGAGQFAPEHASGRRLLAHELTHVVQQQDSEITRIQQRKRMIGNRGEQRLLESNAGECRVRSGTATSMRNGHNFSQVRIHTGVVADEVVQWFPTDRNTVRLETEADSLAAKASRSMEPEAANAVLRDEVGQHEYLDRAGSALGFDFSNVRIHADRTAPRAMDAHAFTVGRKVVVDPDSLNVHGNSLLLHELVHTAQQGAAPARPYAPALQRSPLHVQFQQSRRIRLSTRRIINILNGTAPAEITNLVTRNRLNGRPVEARRVQFNGIEHIFRLQIEITDTPFILHPAMRGIAQPVGQPQRRGNTRTHDISIQLNPNRTWLPGEQILQQVSDPNDRLHSALAETLHHELIHALLLMDRALPEGAPRSTLSQRFQNWMDITRWPGVDALRSSVQETTLILLARALSTIGESISDIPTEELRFFKDDTIRYLVEEKFANQKASGAFGRLRSNESIADVYAENVASRITRLVVRRAGTAQLPASLAQLMQSRPWHLERARLKERIVRLYNEIDVRSQPVPELLPGLQSPPGFISPGPARLGG